MNISMKMPETPGAIGRGFDAPPRRKKEYICLWCRNSGMSHDDCFISDHEIGGVDSRNGEVVCKYCLNLFFKMKEVK